MSLRGISKELRDALRNSRAAESAAQETCNIEHRRANELEARAKIAWINQNVIALTARAAELKQKNDEAEGRLTRPQPRRAIEDEELYGRPGY